MTKRRRVRQREWFQAALQIRGSVIPAVLGRSILYGLFGIFVSYLYYHKVPVHIPALSALIPNLVLGLLLVFRTNTAYERFWEGRKAWGALVNTVRNLARRIWVVIETENSGDREQKIAALRLLVAFAVATKLHLRGEAINSELAVLLNMEQFEQLQQANHPPLKIALFLGEYLSNKTKRGSINPYQFDTMLRMLDTMVDMLGSCERILKTPIPTAYAVHLKQLLLLYCFSLPFQMVEGLGWWTGLVTGLISFTLLGIEEIGIEIENPFGYDPNDLPLDAICETMLRNIENLVSLEPSAARSDDLGDAARVNRLLQKELQL